MKNDQTLLYTFRLGQTGELSYLGNHGAFLDGKIDLGSSLPNSTIDVIIIAVTVIDAVENRVKAEFAQAVRYSITQEGKPFSLDDKATEITLSRLQQNLYAMKAAYILAGNNEVTDHACENDD